MDPQSITLCLNSDDANKPLELIKITKEGFYYKGERVDDIHNVYERFSEWLHLAEADRIAENN